METQSQELMETSSGEAKYEHQHKAIVWRVPRLPKHGQGNKKLPHNVTMVTRLECAPLCGGPTSLTP